MTRPTSVDPPTSAGDGLAAGEQPPPPAAADPATDDAWLDAEPAPRHLRAGQWALTLRGVSVEDVTHRGTLVLSALRVVVRDHDWRTVPVTSSSVEVVDVGGDRLHVLLEADHDELGAAVHWRAELTAEPAGGGARLRLAAGGRVTRAFRRNRLGLVVLHPPELAGSALRVRHPDGSATATTFPAHVAPHQPARDVAGLEWSLQRGEDVLDLALDLRGDVFEMEDQRNWTDASFKTYSTPLSAPFPVPVAPGDGFAHTVELTVTEHAGRAGAAPAGHEVPGRAGCSGVAGATAPAGSGGRGPAAPSGAVVTGSARPDLTQVVLVPTGRTLPRLQLQASTAPGEPVDTSSWWRGPLLVELDATGRAWPGVLARARREAGEAPLDVRITAQRVEELDPVLTAVRRGPLERVAVYDAAEHVTTAALWERLRELAGDPHDRPHGGLPLVGGTRAHFTELNRRHADLPADLPALTFSSTPQMHDTGRRQLLESIAVQRTTAQQAVRIAAGRPVHVGPLTLRPRFNAVATSPRVPDDGDVTTEGCGAEHVWHADDPRQGGRGFAAWLLASHQAFAIAGVASITAVETWGPRGLLAFDGSAFPAAEVVRWLDALQGWELLESALVPGLAVVAARRAERLVVLAADLSGHGRRIAVAGRELSIRPWGTVHHVGAAADSRAAAPTSVRR
ncbi:hypothetical protein GTQ99_02790 [Kineococcus sp. T13]|uniref:hypothetical protein n=1 Tax=Kineococcus vitellinus TaxID=2696565 RepID=UPI001411B2B1|nr:hypothetical protein [Kineococcus vitellinus]NAZ74352.1 hypothetical protein [Kineococcus vitellinus]